LTSLFDLLVRLLNEVGPWIVFAVACIETALFVGLLIPAEATILVAAFLASRGHFTVTSVLAATFFGGLLGDQIGYALGRFGGTRLVAREGRVGRIWRRHEPRAARLFRKHASLSVSLARFISFVRTLMPWFAGMSGMGYGRFLAYDAIGVFGWAAASVALGYLAGESWEAAAHTLGTTSAIIVGLIVLVAAMSVWRGRRRGRALASAGSDRLLRIALTGNIASGKSTVADIWRELGAHVIDADVLAREAVAPGTEGFAAVRARFGSEIVAPDGTIDRGRLRELVFADAGRRTALEQIVHPEVQRLRALEEERLRQAGARVVVNDLPLLYEVGLSETFDGVVHVHADDEIRLARLMHTRGLPEAEARAMMAAQMPSEEKRALAHIVIENNGSLDALKQRAAAVWLELQAWNDRKSGRVDEWKAPEPSA
jgi:dephospho-CoA kinase